MLNPTHLDEILQMSPTHYNEHRPQPNENRPNRPCEEVAQVVELAVLLIFDIDDAPSRLASADWLAINDDIAL